VTSLVQGRRTLGRTALRELAARHGVRPKKSLGQHYLADPNLARRIAALAGTGPGDHILEVGAGLGSLTVALAESGAEVLALEVDRRVAMALREAVAPYPSVRVLVADAMEVDWPKLVGSGSWKMASNLPYNIAVPVIVELLERTSITDYVVMVQREVGDRLAAGPGDDAYGAVSVRIRYRADARVLRRVPPGVFWPAPRVESVLLRITPREPPVDVPEDRLFEVVDEGFAQRRKTMAGALVRLGMERPSAAEALERCGIDPRARAETLGLEDFACLAERIAQTRRG
jgi:16S rRNA (adenine1518-N6/adenine1519-N6)-dimethyltransferase